jgi:general secretion pathway protein E
LGLIPLTEATEQHTVAYLRAKGTLHVASDHPTSRSLPPFLKQLANRTMLRVALSVCSPESFRVALKAYQPITAPSHSGSQPGSAARGATTRSVAPPTASVPGGIESLHQLAERIDEVNTTELLDVIVAGALATGATDIHLEPSEDGLRIRFRIDGVLQAVTVLPLVAYRPLGNRIKYLSKLKLDVTGLPQDGRFEYRAGAIQLDVRTSSLPGLFGELLTLRLLPHDKTFLALDQLGFTPPQLVIIQTALRRPHGLVLATGPTGSGKTTTLYALLALLNRPEVKIVTLEDPVEYRLAGVDQSQVVPAVQYTFARALRSALRHDPDILMVGEIRDGETATTAIEAALTGHLVLSTVHTNDAPGVIPRLLEMGVKPFLLTGIINLIVAQRLVRRICPTCHGQTQQTDPVSSLPTVPVGSQDSPCLTCHGTRYKGRIAIAELLVPNRAIDDLIVEEASTAAFADAAKQAGMIPMAEDGLAKARNGITTVDEIERVTGRSPSR